MNIKQPAFGDGSHWEIVDWDNLDARLLGMIWKITQGKYYVDPTCQSFWIGAGRRKLPRSVFHFFEPDDISAQVENYLTACEDIGIIVSGKWMAEIEPVLDAEYSPPTATSRFLKMIGIETSRLPRKKLLDLNHPEKYLAINPRIHSRTNENFDIVSSVTGPQLAAQYKAWLDGVETELGIKPIIYTSKFMWMHTGFPYWESEYPLWDAQYPNKPDGQDHPLYVPYGHWLQEWGWQYSASAVLQGVTGFMDVSKANCTIEEWNKKYGGGTVPPIGETMEVTPKTTDGCKVRSAPVVDGTNVNQVGSLAYANKLVVSALSGTAGSEQWAQVTWNGAPGYVAVWYRGSQYAVLSGTLPPSTDPTRTHVVEVFSDGKISVDGGPHQ